MSLEGVGGCGHYRWMDGDLTRTVVTFIINEFLLFVCLCLPKTSEPSRPLRSVLDFRRFCKI